MCVRQSQHCWLTVKPISVLPEKKTGASLTTVRSALTVAEKTGKIKKTQAVHGYFKIKQADTTDSTSNENNVVSNENKAVYNVNNVGFDDLNDIDKSRLINEYIQNHQTLYANNSDKTQLKSLGDLHNDNVAETPQFIPKQTDNQEQFTRLMLLQPEPIIRKVLFNPKTL